MMNSMRVDDNLSNLISASNKASISSSHRNEVGSSTVYPDQQSFASPNQPPPPKKRRNLPGNPDPDAAVVALSPSTLMATNRFLCEICNKGFQRDQNLQLHRRGHNLPWKLKQRTNKEVKKVYVCPEATCVHHEPSRALGDLTGIKKHFSRKHGEKKWKCEKCSKHYAVQSDWKAHSKICGTREYRCDCGTLFSRKDTFVTHRAFCDALSQETSRGGITSSIPFLSSQTPLSTSTTSHLNPFPLKTEQDHHHHHSFHLRPSHLPPWLNHSFIYHENPNPNPSQTLIPTLPSFQPTASPHMSATALLQKAAQMSVTMSQPCLSSGGCMEQVGNVNMMNSLLPCGSVFEGSSSSSSFEKALNGMLNPKVDSNIQETLTKQAMEDGGSGGNGLTRDFFGS
ncbi:unnamed protein product [Camellia sinensis]